MKKINVMLYAETLEALCELPNEDLGALVKHINDWNNGKEVIIENPFHKSMWKIILPDLERNKETYLNIVERNTQNGKKGGRPKKTQETQSVYLGNPEEPQKPNYNYNYINSSKEELINIQQPSSSSDDSVVSKGLEKLESIFPQGRNKVGIEEVNLWNGCTQEAKAELIKRATVYIRNEKKNDEGKYIKGLGKWLRESLIAGVDITPKSKNTSTKIGDSRLFKFTDGAIYDYLLRRLNSSTKADKAYLKLNNKERFATKEDLIAKLKVITIEELNELIA